MREWLRDHGLLVANLALFLIFFGGMVLSGVRVYNSDQLQHGQQAVSLSGYLLTGAFYEATFENWESEFLQMAAFVVLTVFLIQKGSSESKDPDKSNPEDDLPHQRRGDPSAPWPVHRGGLLLKLYSHSLSIALVSLFLLSFWLHLAGSTRRMNEEAVQHHQPIMAVQETLLEPEFWYESFQNWQSEFLSIAVLLILGIFLREQGSPESKPVAAPHSETGH